jgi:hypothetical protein
LAVGPGSPLAIPSDTEVAGAALDELEVLARFCDSTESDARAAVGASCSRLALSTRVSIETSASGACPLSRSCTSGVAEAADRERIGWGGPPGDGVVDACDSVRTDADAPDATSSRRVTAVTGVSAFRVAGVLTEGRASRTALGATAGPDRTVRPGSGGTGWCAAALGGSGARLIAPRSRVATVCGSRATGADCAGAPRVVLSCATPTATAPAASGTSRATSRSCSSSSVCSASAAARPFATDECSESRSTNGGMKRTGLAGSSSWNQAPIASSMRATGCARRANTWRVTSRRVSRR